MLASRCGAIALEDGDLVAARSALDRAAESAEAAREHAWVGILEASTLALRAARLPIAARWLTRAAEQGHAEAQFHLSWALLQGENSNSSAHRWFAAASAADPVAAERNRALLFPDGLGLPRDPEGAVRWARLAAEAGHSEAQAQLAHLLAQGIGCERSPAEARLWYERAAQSKVARGELGIGAMLLHGVGG